MDRRLARVQQRPEPCQWGEDEVLTLAEAAALFFPQGPLTLASLRTAVAKGGGLKSRAWRARI